MRRIFVIAALTVGLTRLGAQSAPSDPLATAYSPNIDTNPADYPSNIWITGPLAKVLQDSGSPGTVHWAVVYTTKNEFQSFQVHVQAGVTPIQALNVTVSDLVNSQTSTSISAGSTDIVVYREAYENVTIPTATGATFLNTTGHIPDILIPAVDPYYHQTTNAFPFTVQPGKNQSVWIDVHTPAQAPSGYYSGTVTVSDGSTVLAKLPVVYAVWDWQMPSTASLGSDTSVSYGGFCNQAYGSIAGCSQYPGASGSSDYGVTLSNADAAVQLLDNRYSLNFQNIYPGAGTFDPPAGSASFDGIYGPLLSGASANVSTILQGARLTNWTIGAIASLSPLPATYQNFVNHWSSEGWSGLINFLMDEPYGDAEWSQLIAQGTAEHAYSTPVIPNVVTTDLPSAMKYNAANIIDRLVPNIVILEPSTGIESLSAYQNWIAGGPSTRSFWSYLSCMSAGTCTNGNSGQSTPGFPNSYPNYDVDGTPVANRVMEWMTYLHGQTGELYYTIDVCSPSTGVSTLCGVSAPGVTTSPLNPLVSNYYAGGWGDGTLMYPGSPAYTGTTIPIWLPSMRLKMIRDGMQDYEYLHAVANLGQASFVQEQISSFITNSYTFSNDPAALETAREALGNVLHNSSLSIVSPAPPQGPAPPTGIVVRTARAAPPLNPRR